MRVDRLPADEQRRQREQQVPSLQAGSADMRISVCMATHNGEQYLPEQLSSVVPQLAPEDELIISDDSSTDATISILERVGDKRVKLLTGNTFYNPIYNFENALKRAGGDVIVMCDQDDVWLENKLSVVRRSFREKASDIYTIVLDGCITDEAGIVLKDSIFDALGSGKGILKNLYENTYMGCSMAFSHELLEIALPFPEGIPMHDSWLGLLTECFGTVRFVREKTIMYRRHTGNRSYQRFTVSQQVRWRTMLAYHLLRRCVAARSRSRSSKKV